jgi:hypothetical protein
MGTLERSIWPGLEFCNSTLRWCEHSAFGEKQTFQVRGEAFNILNRVNLATPVATVNSSNFGKITADISGPQAGGLVASSGGPEIVQLALKFVF